MFYFLLYRYDLVRIAICLALLKFKYCIFVTCFVSTKWKNECVFTYIYTYIYTYAYTHVQQLSTQNPYSVVLMVYVLSKKWLLKSTRSNFKITSCKTGILQYLFPPAHCFPMRRGSLEFFSHVRWKARWVRKFKFPQTLPWGYNAFLKECTCFMCTVFRSHRRVPQCF